MLKNIKVMNFKLKKIQDILFFLIVFCVIFDYMPKAMWLTFFGLGGPYSAMLGNYPIIAGFLLTVYMTWNGYISIWNRYVALFFVICLIVYEVSALHGLYIYPYWDLVLNAPEPQIEKLPGVLSFLHNHNINISHETLFSTWIFLRSAKTALFDLLYSFGLSYMIYLWYKNDLKRAWKVFWSGLLAGLFVFVLYGFVDVCFLHGSSSATFILQKINPLLHDIGKIHDWWPPLLWQGQFRSVFCEPSRVGNYIAFALPLLFIPVINKAKNWKYYVILIYVISYMVFLTNARTAVAMLIGIMGLTTITLLLFRWKDCLKRFAVIVLMVMLAFGTSLASITIISGVGKNNNMNVSATITLREEDKDNAAIEYLENNVGSLASTNKRSNQARYALIKSNFKIGMEHPLLGVGPLLNGAYVVENFDDFDLQSGEVQQWVKAYWEMGPLKHNFDAMNEYVTTFSTTGILGLFSLLFPFGYGCFRLLQSIKKSSNQTVKRTLLCLFIATVSSLIVGCNGSLNLIYAIWLLLPLIYIYLTENKEFGNEKPF